MEASMNRLLRRIGLTGACGGMLTFSDTVALLDRTPAALGRECQ